MKYAIKRSGEYTRAHREGLLVRVGMCIRFATHFDTLNDVAQALIAHGIALVGDSANPALIYEIVGIEEVTHPTYREVAL